MQTNYRQFPHTRLRRTRMQAWTRSLVQENRLSVQDLIWPIFITEDENNLNIPNMPGVHRLTLKSLIPQVQEAADLGIPAIAIFPVTPSNKKNAQGSEALNPNNLICRACQIIRKHNINIGIICDVALDPYTDHGHDGIFINNEIANDETVDILCQQALIQAEAGCDIIAPSDMMDGRIAAIREHLDAYQKQNTLILAYAAKYASKFYGPFRQAIDSSSKLGNKDKNSYQMNPANSDESLHEIALDIQEGADMILIKPGMPYLDIVYRSKKQFKLPTFAYQVSGEYTMLTLLAKQSNLAFTDIMQETLICFKRAGADAIFTYAAKQIAQSLNKNQLITDKDPA